MPTLIVHLVQFMILIWNLVTAIIHGRSIPITSATKPLKTIMKLMEEMKTIVIITMVISNHRQVKKRRNLVTIALQKELQPLLPPPRLSSHRPKKKNLMGEALIAIIVHPGEMETTNNKKKITANKVQVIIILHPPALIVRKKDSSLTRTIVQDFIDVSTLTVHLQNSILNVAPGPFGMKQSKHCTKYTFITI